jgi:hypothetical protein
MTTTDTRTTTTVHYALRTTYDDSKMNMTVGYWPNEQALRQDLPDNEGFIAQQAKLGGTVTIVRVTRVVTTDTTTEPIEL